jgi:hypothetical protein
MKHSTMRNGSWLESSHWVGCGFAFLSVGTIHRKVDLNFELGVETDATVCNFHPVERYLMILMIRMTLRRYKGSFLIKIKTRSNFVEKNCCCTAEEYPLIKFRQKISNHSSKFELAIGYSFWSDGKTVNVFNMTSKKRVSYFYHPSCVSDTELCCVILDAR